MTFANRVTRLFNIEFPIIQAGMVWTSGWKLASAVSNAGGLGLIGAGSMNTDLLHQHITKCRAATDKPFGVNVPLLYSGVEDHLELIIKLKVPIVFTSAGNPKLYTARLKDAGIKVVHVVSSSLFAQKAEAAGCDAVVAEGFEAGGHNGREETSTLVLIPGVCSAVKIPVIAAGGIATGRQMLASMVLGAEGVQVGSAFVCTHEASCHAGFKQAVVAAKEGDTLLSMKKYIPVRLLKNSFFEAIQTAEAEGMDAAGLKQILGKGRARLGMFDGDLQQGELEIGQVSSLLTKIAPAAEVLREIWQEFSIALHEPLMHRT